MEKPERSIPSKRRYTLGMLLSAAGIAVVVVLQISSTDPDFRLIMPGSQEIEMDTGEYTLFYEHRTVLSGEEYISEITVPDIRFFVMAPDESGIELTVTSGDETGVRS